MEISALTYPYGSYERLYEILKPRMKKLKPSKNTRYEFSSLDSLFFLKSGKVTVISDGFSNLVAPPFLFGLVGCLGYSYDLHIRTNIDSELYSIKTTEALEVIRSANAWEDVSSIIAYNNMLLFSIYSQMRNPFKTTKYKIAKAIEAVFYLQNKHGRKFYLAKEVISLTLLSRSIVMKNLSVLKERKVVDIRDGILFGFDQKKLDQYHMAD